MKWQTTGIYQSCAYTLPEDVCHIPNHLLLVCYFSWKGFRLSVQMERKPYMKLFSRVGFCTAFDMFHACQEKYQGKLSECNIPSQLFVKILDDINKVGDTSFERLVDATDDDDIRGKLSSAQDSCWCFETTSSCNLEKFIQRTNYLFYVIQCQSLSGVCLREPSRYLHDQCK